MSDGMRDAMTLTVDPIRCDGRGLCADLLPEMIRLDDWGYPILERREVPAHLLGHAERAVKGCPVLALKLQGKERARRA
jgi:ferredoxin